MKKFEHADFLKALAEAGQESQTPWDQAEYSNDGGLTWLPLTEMPTNWLAGVQYRMRPTPTVVSIRLCIIRSPTGRNEIGVWSSLSPVGAQGFMQRPEFVKWLGPLISRTLE